MQPAKQNRSRETLNRILQATQKLLCQQSFDEVSVRRIITESGTSIGSFYARFRDKDELLSALYAEYEIDLKKSQARLKESIAGAKSLNNTAQKIVEHFVEIYGEIPNLSRALFEYAMRSPKALDSKKLATRRNKQYAFLYDSLLTFRSEITHRDPSRAVELAVYFMVVVCRNRLLYPQSPQTRLLKISKQELTDELVRNMIGYLGQ